MPRVGFEPTISAGERPKTYALDRAATGTGILWFYLRIIYVYLPPHRILYPFCVWRSPFVDGRFCIGMHWPTWRNAVIMTQLHCFLLPLQENGTLLHPKVGRDSLVGIATAYGLDGSVIESRWRRDFPHLSRPALRPTQPPCTMGTGSFPGVRCGRGVTLTPHPLLVPKVKNRVELYLYSP